MKDKQKGFKYLRDATKKYFCFGIVDDDEREAIGVHKYYMSQKAGYDVGWILAYAHWKIFHANKWRKGRRK